jgi:hypothetical protein
MYTLKRRARRSRYSVEGIGVYILPQSIYIHTATSAVLCNAMLCYGAVKQHTAASFSSTR